MEPFVFFSGLTVKIKRLKIMKKSLIILAAGLFFTFSANSLFAWRGSSGCGYDGYIGPHWFGLFNGGGMFMGIFTLVILGLLIFFGINYFRKDGILAGGKERPLEILKIRYAKGEITKEEFDAMKKEIAGE